jgi:hypothetical protein
MCRDRDTADACLCGYAAAGVIARRQLSTATRLPTHSGAAMRSGRTTGGCTRMWLRWESATVRPLSLHTALCYGAIDHTRPLYGACHRSVHCQAPHLNQPGGVSADGLRASGSAGYTTALFVTLVPHTRAPFASPTVAHSTLLCSGAWFGVPMFCMSLGPLVMAALASRTRESADAFMLRHVAACVLGATLLFWGWCVRRSVRLTPHALAKNVGGIAVAYLYVARPFPLWLIAERGTAKGLSII